MEVPSELLNRMEAAGQGHLLHFWSDLPESEKAEFVGQLNGIDFEECVRFYNACAKTTETGLDCAKLTPLPAESCGSAATLNPEEKEKMFQEGLQLIAEGSVGVILLAGGQGTRLGVSYPKGQFDIGLASGASLFELQAQRILKLQELAGGIRSGTPHAPIPWYIMTSPATHEPTEEFFKKNSFFGLLPSQVEFFDQGLLPCFDNDGKMILDKKGWLAMAPDGNGGLYRGLAKAGLVEKMAGSGIRHLHVYCVDNCLVKVADPLFLAFAHRLKAVCAAKVVEKTDPHEAVGVICQYQTAAGKNEVRVVEYSEISSEQAEARDGDGRLSFRAGNIANHYFHFDFLRQIVTKHQNDLVHHVARKKIPAVDTATGLQVKPSAPNGIKMEMFVFDVFAFAQRFGAWSVAREEEFAPLKNADDAGKDCPETARRAFHSLHKRWLEAAGASVMEHGGVEISPLLSYSGEGLGFWSGRTVHTPTLLLPESHLAPH